MPSCAGGGTGGGEGGGEGGGDEGGGLGEGGENGGGDGGGEGGGGVGGGGEGEGGGGGGGGEGGGADGGGGAGGDEGGGEAGGACRTYASTWAWCVKSSSVRPSRPKGFCARQSAYRELRVPSMPPGSRTHVERLRSSSPPKASGSASAAPRQRVFATGMNRVMSPACILYEP